VLWPVIATILRFVVAAAFAATGVHWFHMGLNFICACIAAGMVVYGVVTAMSIHLGAWRVRA
jgi:hypothetical protein